MSDPLPFTSPHLTDTHPTDLAPSQVSIIRLASEEPSQGLVAKDEDKGVKETWGREGFGHGGPFWTFGCFLEGISAKFGHF